MVGKAQGKVELQGEQREKIHEQAHKKRRADSQNAAPIYGQEKRKEQGLGQGKEQDAESAYKHFPAVYMRRTFHGAEPFVGASRLLHIAHAAGRSRQNNGGENRIHQKQVNIEHGAYVIEPGGVQIIQAPQNPGGNEEKHHKKQQGQTAAAQLFCLGPSLD